jgi:two-component system, chemotaxis family, protein-glutamate methylesterase/glutaminase
LWRAGADAIIALMGQRRKPSAPARAGGVPRRTRGGLAPFGRKGASGEGTDLTDLGCPDCRGVLAVEERSPGQLSFVCRVGHAYAGETLVTAKEDQVENALWSAVECYEEVALLGNEMAAKLRGVGARGLAIDHQRRARRAISRAAELRRLISRDRPAMLPDEGE